MLPSLRKRIKKQERKPVGMAPVVHGVIYSPVVPALDAWAGPAEDSSAPFSFSLPVVWGRA